MGRASRRKRERRKHREKTTKDLDRFAESLNRESEQPVVLHRNPASRKISDALVTLIQPWLGGEESLDEYRALVEIGEIAWNLALLDPQERKEELASAVKKLATPDADLFRQVLEGMVARKYELFPQDRGVVVGVAVADPGVRDLILGASTEGG